MFDRSLVAGCMRRCLLHIILPPEILPLYSRASGMYGAKRQTITLTGTKKARAKSSDIGKRGHATNHSLLQHVKLVKKNESRVNHAMAPHLVSTLADITGVRSTSVQCRSIVMISLCGPFVGKPSLGGGARVHFYHRVGDVVVC